MRLEFKLDDLSEILDENECLKDYSEYTKEKDGYTYDLWMFRVVIPELHLSFRVGDAYERNPEVEDLDDSDAYDYLAGVTVIYRDDEHDFNNYLYAITASESYAIYRYCQGEHIDCDDPSNLNCYCYCYLRLS